MTMDAEPGKSDLADSASGFHLEALRKLAAIHTPRSFEDVRAAVARPPGGSGDAAGRAKGESDLEEAVIREYSRSQAAAGAAAIADARRALANAGVGGSWGHAVAELLRGHPLVPAGREELFARGLSAGLEGDLPAAVHLLLPQMESSLRRLLELRGFPVQRRWGDGWADRPLNDFLTDSAAEPILGKNLAWELRSLLVEHGGPNLRNRVCHGQATVGDCRGPHAEYLVWVSLWFLVRFREPTAGAEEGRVEHTTDSSVPVLPDRG